MVLSAMMAGMDDKEDTEDDITLEAMSGLSRVLAKINESDIRAILINVALRIRPCFEKVIFKNITKTKKLGHLFLKEFFEKRQIFHKWKH